MASVDSCFFLFSFLQVWCVCVLNNTYPTYMNFFYVIYCFEVFSIYVPMHVNHNVKKVAPNKFYFY